MVFIACNSSDSILEGKWKLISPFYKASCQIIKKGNGFEGLILSYNDGTSTYQYDANKPFYAFTCLKKQGGIYVDGVSGATQQKGKTKVSAQLISKDTLQLTTLIANQELKEIWARIK